MSDQKERRFYERIQIPGAEVAYRERQKLNWFKGYNGPVPMKDITKSGICFKLMNRLERGATVEIKISIPGEEQFSVTGNIVWTNMDRSSDDGYAGVQFRPFGKGHQYNSFRTHERLEHITQHFAKS